MHPNLHAPLRPASKEAFTPRCAGERRPAAHGIRRLGDILILLLLAFLPGASPARAETTAGQTAWRLLDHLAVDYRSAVQDGRVINPGEYAEISGFAVTAHALIAALPASSAKADLQRRAAGLEQLIAQKAPGGTVAMAARELADDLIKAYPVPLASALLPDIARGRALFAQSCLSCHGANGDGKGPAAPALIPPPTAFTDRSRARERSVFALQQVIEQGLPGTGMASFAGLPPQARWDLAFYAGAFAYPESLVDEGRRIWQENATLRAGLDLGKLVDMTPAALAHAIGEARAAAVTAYLRRHPRAALGSAAGPFTLARARLAEALAAYANGGRDAAADLMLSAYLDGFEPAEPILAVRDNALKVRIEEAMGTLRAGVAKRLPPDDLQIQAAALDALLAQAETVLGRRTASAGSSFLGSFTILLREGLEAILIVVAMLAFLRKVGRTDARPYVHGGWIAALLAGVLTWGVGTHLIGISGVSRELAEGIGSILAALILLWVGVWMHRKRNVQVWQDFIGGQLTRALTRRSVWLLFGLSFLVVYREVFETILFYAAIWNQGHGGAMLVGGATAAFVLVAVAAALLHFGHILPIGRFFAWSSGLIALLAVVLTGKGVAALQEAGCLPVHPLASFPRIEILGLFPTREGLIAPLAMIFFLALGFGCNHRPANQAPRPTD